MNIEQAERLAKGLKQTMESTVVGTMPAIPDPPSRPIENRIGLPAEVIAPESREKTEAAELARTKEEAHAAELEAARLRGQAEGMKMNERRAA
jgi:hypothetical protein